MHVHAGYGGKVWYTQGSMVGMYTLVYSPVHTARYIQPGTPCPVQHARYSMTGCSMTGCSMAGLWPGYGRVIGGYRGYRRVMRVMRD